MDTDALLDELRATRRLVEQLLKADPLLRSAARRLLKRLWQPPPQRDRP